MNNKIIKIGLILVVISAIAGFFIFDLGQYMSLEYIKNSQQGFADYYMKNKIFTIAIFFGIYVAVTALSFPGAVIMTLAAGALFGTVTGTIIVSFASTIGATLAFLMARFVLRDAIEARFSDKLSSINNGVEKEGAFYLFALRLVPAFPFFIINVVMGLTKIKTITFYWVSQLGMLAGTGVYVYAGTQLAEINSLADIASPKLILAFVLLGIFPIVTKKIMKMMRG